jgi:hypothetical protein
MLVDQFLSAINKGAVPEIHGAWESVSFQENQKAFEHYAKVQPLSQLF